MLTGRCCHCDLKPITIKGLNKLTGETLWTYGPGHAWTRHYGSSHVSGVVVPDPATLTRYVLTALANSSDNAWAPVQGRQVPGRPQPWLDANTGGAISLVKLDANSGQVVSTTSVPEWSSAPVAEWKKFDLRSMTGLSGGDVVFVGTLPVQIEWVNFTVNTASKQYVMHAHNQQAGNIYLRTLTSDEYITLPYNATAAQVQSAFEATADCVTAVASGGPWPHRKIALDVVWSQPTGDIKYLKTDYRYAVSSGGGGGTCTWDWVLSPTGNYWGLNTNNCTGGAVPTPPSVPGSPGDNDIPGTCVGGSSGPSAYRYVYGAATRYNTTTGLIESSVGFRFGLRSGSVPPNLIAASSPVPTSSLPATDPVDIIRAGANNTVVVLTANSGYLEGWDTAGNWTALWQRHNNTHWLGVNNEVYQDKLLVTFLRESYSSGYRAYAAVTGSSGAVTEYDSARAVVGRSTGVGFVDGGTSSIFEAGYSARLPNGRDFCLDGSRVYDGAVDLHLPGSTTLADATAYYRKYGDTAMVPEVIPAGQYGNGNIANSNAKWYIYKYYCPVDGKFSQTTEFRFRFGSSWWVPKVTQWLPYSATPAQIKAALLAVFPENTGGVVSNVTLYPGNFGGNYTSIISNADYGLFDIGLGVWFAAYRNAAGRAEGYIDPQWVDWQRVTLEWRNAAPYVPQSIFSASRANGVVNWSKRWGSKGGVNQYPFGGPFVLVGNVLVVGGPYIDAE